MSANRDRPYPNVVATKSNPPRFEARHPRNGSHVYLGTYSTAETARRVVLEAQAEHLEGLAAAYRVEAAKFPSSRIVERLCAECFTYHAGECP